ncbi:MAG: DUF5309 domain-containing protein [Muribaculaceae bacterium]|nr:DUF5309 domain-containing protein [Muribaculaceae bacterium]
MSSPITLATIAETSPELLRNAIDQRITRIRPMSTPVDQLSRCAASRKAASMTVEYYSVDAKATTALLATAIEGGPCKRQNGVFVLEINTDSNSIFEPSETVLIPSALDRNQNPIVGYVLEVADSGVKIAIVNAASETSSSYIIPDIGAGSVVERMGRAATELDVQTAQFAVLPEKKSNNCQIFKMQVEQSTLARLASKEVGWGFSDQEEAAVIDMRLGMEKSFLFGQKALIHDPVKHEDVFLTGGIWNQAGRDHDIDMDNMTESALVSLCAKVFTGQCGSKKKILIGGTDLIEQINNIPVAHITVGQQKFVKWGVEFREIVSNFGTLYVLHSEVFDQCGHGSDGIVIDPDYMTKYVHIPFRSDTLDLRAAGMRNTDAVVLTEASCLVLRYPDAHCRIHGR